MPTKLSRKDFVQVDSHWIYAVDGFHLSLAPDTSGNFKLLVYGTIKPIPPATTSPTEPEWEKAEILGQKFIDAFEVARFRE